MESGLTTELMSLLEKIVLHNSDFAKYKKLQNLLKLKKVVPVTLKEGTYANLVDVSLSNSSRLFHKQRGLQ